ncbi:MAG: FMN-binding protein [Candidatus Krumholzibacteria bacterium]|nr:FMN-binding protein [Candidatus Krumholzibacteria bacterium]
MTAPGAKTPAAPAPAPEPSGLRMVLTMGGIGLIAGVLIVLTYQLTFPVIAINQARALERAVFEVVPGAASRAGYTLSGDELVPLGPGEQRPGALWACYDTIGALVGVAVEASGQGFQDVVRILYGYSPATRRIVGMKVLESKETPGLGDKIDKDPAFKANFAALDIGLSADAAEWDHEIELVKKGQKSEAWQVEAITGATISSRAIAAILRESTARTAPAITRGLPTLEEGGP